MSRSLPSVSILDEGALPVAQLARIAVREGFGLAMRTRRTSGSHVDSR